MADLLMDVVTYLQSKSLVQGDAIDAFRDFIPESPDSVTAVYEYAGTPPPLFDTACERSVQIVVRDKSATVAKLKARAIYKELSPDDSFANLTVQRWCLLNARNTPIKIKVDNSGRTYYGFNLGITTNID